MLVSTVHAAARSGSEQNQVDTLFPPFDPAMFSSQILWLALTFGFLYFFIARVGLPRIGNILEVRKDRISQDMIEAQRLKDKTDDSIAAYEQELAEAKNRARIIVQKASYEAKNTADAERKKIETYLVEKLTDAEQRIGATRNAAMEEVGGVAEVLAESIVTRLIGSKISRAKLAKAVETVTEQI